MSEQSSAARVGYVYWGAHGVGTVQSLSPDADDLGALRIVVVDAGGKRHKLSMSDFFDRYPHELGLASTLHQGIAPEYIFVQTGDTYAAADGGECQVTAIVPQGDGLEPLIVYRLVGSGDTGELGYQDFRTQFPKHLCKLPE